MNLVRMEDIKRLIGSTDERCVSIFMPTHRSGRKEVEQDPIRFKNLVRRAEAELMAGGMRAPEAAELMARPLRLHEDWNFWNHQSDGLAVFVSENSFEHYRVPFTFPESVSVGDRFHIKPLVPLVTNDGMFYVLALSMDRVRVLQGTRHSVAELDLGSLPRNMADALRWDNPQKELQFYTGSPQGAPRAQGKRRQAMFFGTGAGDEDVKNALVRYFQKVDNGLQVLLREEQRPLVLAGVEYLFPLFRQASKYRTIIEGVTGNPDDQPLTDLHQRAWELVEPHFKAAQDEAVRKFRNLRGTDGRKASESLVEIVPMAVSGRVDSLFVPVDRQRFGSFDTDTMRADVHGEPQSGDQDLIDLAAAHTIINDGAVYVLEAAVMPGGGDAAATFRY